METTDTHSRYLETLGDLSRAKMQNIIDDLHGVNHTDERTMSGPGIYASRWQSLLDETLITPSVPNGPPRCGKDVKSHKAVRKPDNRPNSDTSNLNTSLLSRDKPGLTPPDVSTVVETLGPQFKGIVAGISLSGLPKV